MRLEWSRSALLKTSLRILEQYRNAEDFAECFSEQEHFYPYTILLSVGLSVVLAGTNLLF